MFASLHLGSATALICPFILFGAHALKPLQHLLINVYLNGRILSKSIIKNHQYSNFLQVAESSQKKYKGTDTASSLIKTPKKTVDAATCETLETPNNLRRDDSRRLKEKGIIDFVVILVQYSAEIFSSYMKKKIHFLFE